MQVPSSLLSLKTISKTKKNASLGYLYAATTAFLGMKPMEHEFKVMGLAPYAKQKKVIEVYDELKQYIWLDGLEFKSKFDMVFSDNLFNEKFRFVRFDVLSGAVQMLVEELTSEWVRRAVSKTGIRDIALAGGVFMNVKANQKIAELPEVNSVFPMPSSGDESNAVGACFYGYKIFCEKNNIPFNPKPITHLYLGPEYSEDYVLNWIKSKNISDKYKITKSKNINKDIAKLLSKWTKPNIGMIASHRAVNIPYLITYLIRTPLTPAVFMPIWALMPVAEPIRLQSIKKRGVVISALCRGIFRSRMRAKK
jgi:carbamoyltransferase